MTDEMLIRQNRRREFLTDLKKLLDKHDAGFNIESADYGSTVEMTYDLYHIDYPQSYILLTEKDVLDSRDIELLIERE